MKSPVIHRTCLLYMGVCLLLLLPLPGRVAAQEPPARHPSILWSQDATGVSTESPASLFFQEKENGSAFPPALAPTTRMSARGGVLLRNTLIGATIGGIVGACVPLAFYTANCFFSLRSPPVLIGASIGALIGANTVLGKKKPAPYSVAVPQPPRASPTIPEPGRAARRDL